MHPELGNNLEKTYTNGELNRIIYGVLKRLHINFYHPNRADYEHEARLIMAEAMIDSAKLNHVTNRNVYLFQRVYWRLLDQLRTENKKKAHINLSFDQLNDEDDAEKSLEKILRDFSADHHFVQCETELFFAQLIKRLTPHQRRYLQMIHLGYTGPEIAERLNISRQAVANLRQRVIIAGRQLLKEG